MRNLTQKHQTNPNQGTYSKITDTFSLKRPMPCKTKKRLEKLFQRRPETWQLNAMHGLESSFAITDVMRITSKTLHKVYKLNNNVVSLFISKWFWLTVLWFHEKYLGVKGHHTCTFQMVQEKTYINVNTHTQRKE